MSYKPTKTFNGVQGEASVDSGGPAYLSHDIEELTKMFDPSSTHSIDTDHPTAQPGGINKEHLSFTITNDYDNTEKAKVTSAYTHANTTNANPHSTDAELIPIDTIEGLTGTEVQTALESLNTKVVNHETTYSGAIDYITFDNTDGKFRFFKVGDHTTPTVTIDTALEKVVTNFTYDRTTRSLILVHPDGTTESVPLSDLVTEYDFINTSDISFSVSNHQVSATISTSYKTTIEQLKTAAESAATNASTYATNSAASATQSSGYADNASASATASGNSATAAANSSSSASSSASAAGQSANSASQSATTSSEKAVLSRSWAVGGTGTRTGEDTNNAKYWAEQASESASGDMKRSVYDPTTGGVANPVATAGGIPAYVEANGGKIDHIKVNGTEQTIADKTVDISVPTVDSTPTSGSTNAVQSGGTYTALQEVKTYAKTQDGRRTRTDITNNLSNLPTAIAEQNLEKYGYTIGDYFTGASGYTYYLADMDTAYGGYSSYGIVGTHHCGVVVDTHSTTTWLSSGSASSYSASTLHSFLTSTALPLIKSDITALFGDWSSHMLARNVLDNGVGGWGTTWTGLADCYLTAMSEVQMYGARVFGCDGNQTGTEAKPLELFMKYRWNEIYGNVSVWLKSLYSASGACYASDDGAAYAYGLAYSRRASGLILLY